MINKPQMFNHQTEKWDNGPTETTVEAYLPYIGDKNAQAIFEIRVNHQGYAIEHAYIHVLKLLLGKDYPLTDEHKAKS